MFIDVFVSCTDSQKTPFVKDSKPAVVQWLKTFSSE